MKSPVLISQKEKPSEIRALAMRSKPFFEQRGLDSNQSVID